MVCKENMTKILITRKKDDSIKDNRDALYDPDTDVYFQNPACKKHILGLIGFFC